MEDPVIVPTSNVSLDRKSIEYHILQKHNDPFNRKPLTKEELIPNIELKKRIEEYKMKKMKDLQNNNIEIYKEDDNNKVNIENDKNNYKEDNFNNIIKENNSIFHKENDSNISIKCDDIINIKYENEKEIFEKKINNYNNDIYNDAPNEFLDPLFCELMEDPVILPTSNIIIDRKNIENFLLNVHKDPFNRKPLTKEELIPNIELKKRIDEYKLKKIKNLKNNNSDEYKDYGNKNEINIGNNKEEKYIETNTYKQDDITPTKEKEENKEEKNQNE